MSQGPRFEIVHTGPRQFHGRFVAGNGEVVWWTETYTRRDSANHAIWLVVGAVLREKPNLHVRPRYPVVDERPTKALT